ncbi:MAG: hypothetical protein LBQ39_00955, partial [Tannerellaceae bacterium]|nr:hypothetical protein [Tannerellaceae bacterium]
MIKKFFILCVLAAVALQSCSDAALTDFSVNMESIILPVGESARIKVKFTPSDAADVKLVWSSN